MSVQTGRERYPHFQALFGLSGWIKRAQAHIPDSLLFNESTVFASSPQFSILASDEPFKLMDLPVKLGFLDQH